MSLRELGAAMAAGDVTAVELTEDCLTRIATTDPAIGSIIALDPTAAEQAAESDRRIAAGQARPLEGVPVLVKDNIAVTSMPTTAGSRALAESHPSDAPLVTRLREAGAVIVGKTNLSEWANFRSTHSTSGWSGVGGQTRNPHMLERNTSGSSSGSGAAVAAGLAPVAIGTETDGSIVSPAGMCGVVGFKPTLGIVPGAGIVPLSSQQDVAGPMTRHVADAALVLAVLAGMAAEPLDAAALRGARIGVWLAPSADRETTDVLDQAVGAILDAGAQTVAVSLDTTAIEAVEWPALIAEFAHELNAYLASAPGASVATLRDLVEFNRDDPIELRHFGQEVFEQALDAPPITDDAYRAQRAEAKTLAQSLVDDLLREHSLDAIVTLTNDPAWPIDYVAGDQYHISTTTPAAVAGYPSLTVPAGYVGALPIGVSFFGTSHSDAGLLQLGYAFEQATHARRDPGYLASTD
jgi:amidase